MGQTKLTRRVFMGAAACSAIAAWTPQAHFAASHTRRLTVMSPIEGAVYMGMPGVCN